MHGQYSCSVERKKTADPSKPKTDPAHSRSLNDLMDINVNKINAMNSPDAKTNRGSESPKNKTLPSSEGDNNIPPNTKVALSATNEL